MLSCAAYTGHRNIAGVQEIFEDSQSFFLVMELVSGGECSEHDAAVSVYQLERCTHFGCSWCYPALALAHCSVCDRCVEHCTRTCCSVTVITAR
eukprot:14821-Heterococcus_DN1.PRE.2